MVLGAADRVEEKDENRREIKLKIT